MHVHDKLLFSEVKSNSRSQAAASGDVSGNFGVLKSNNHLEFRDLCARPIWRKLRNTNH
jgi:hypothetical protein